MADELRRIKNRLNVKYSMFDFSVLLKELETCINNKMYYSALMLALVIPDECGLIAYNTNKVGTRYKRWVNEYASFDDYFYLLKYTSKPFLNGELIYSLRNHIMHNGMPIVDEEENKVFYFEFNESNSKYRSRDEFSGITKVTINIPYLCNILYKAGKQFYLNNKESFSQGNDYMTAIPDDLLMKKI